MGSDVLSSQSFFFFKFSLISFRLQITLLINTVLISKTRAVGGTTSFRNPSS